MLLVVMWFIVVCSLGCPCQNQAAMLHATPGLCQSSHIFVWCWESCEVWPCLHLWSKVVLTVSSWIPCFWWQDKGQNLQRDRSQLQQQVDDLNQRLLAQEVSVFVTLGTQNADSTVHADKSWRNLIRHMWGSQESSLLLSILSAGIHILIHVDRCSLSFLCHCCKNIGLSDKGEGWQWPLKTWCQCSDFEVES